MVRIALPPPTNVPNPIFLPVLAGTELVRVYNPHRHGQTACSFKRFGPNARFDHHRHPAANPAIDNDRGIYYAAPTLSSCIVEVFGDTGQIVCGEHHAALVRVTRDIRLLDLCGNGAMRSGTVAAMTGVEHTLAQAWSNYFYDHLDYQLPDGLQYNNAHNHETAYALYERAETALECLEDLPLNDPDVLIRLALIARETNISLVP